MAEDRSKRSYRYQHKFKEVPLESVNLDRFPSATIDSDVDIEDRKIAKEELIGLLFKIADGILTPRQLQIFELRYKENLRQKEIADILGITQGAVSLALNGIPNYTYHKKHGGILPKLKKYCMQSASMDAKAILQLLSRL